MTLGITTNRYGARPVRTHQHVDALQKTTRGVAEAEIQV
jgi:hypothetical protein